MAKKVIEDNPKQIPQRNCEPSRFMFWLLIVGMLALGISGLMLHLKIHADITWLTWILLFDITIITLLYLSKKTIFYAFALNTVFFIVGVIAHFSVLGIKGGIGDVLIAVPDFVMGYILWVLYK